MVLVILAFALAGAQSQLQSGNAARGEQAFETCAACHSLVPGRNMTGPSLAGVWARKAGSLESFNRYSPALKASRVVWGDKTLDAWLTSPAAFIPNNYMTFAGIRDPQQRADIVAFLKEASSGRVVAQSAQGGGMARQHSSLRNVTPDRTVRSIRICKDSYFVTTAAGKTIPFWEPNLRFKTDSSNLGPAKGKPAIVPAGMMGDRADVIFASPSEISAAIKHQC